MTTWRSHALGLLLLLAACGEDPSGPLAPVPARARTPASESEAALTFLRPDSGFAVVPASVSFYAVNGQAREGTLWYHRHVGSPDSTRLARLRLDRRSLVRRPDGTPIAPGDSLLITMSISDSDRFVITFEPSGLVFAPRRTAELTLWYHQADPDFNHDGVVDAADTAVESTFQIWRQEGIDDPWFAEATELQADVDEASTEIRGFTRYAVAY